MTLDKDAPATELNPHEPQYSGWRMDADSARNFRQEIQREERELLRKNQEEHEELRLRVDRLEQNEVKREPVIKAASSLAAASHAVKAVIVIIAVLISVITGAIQLFDRWSSK